MSSILVLNGPNLNLLGTREPDVYGSDTLDSINARLQKQAYAANFGFSTLQSNSETKLIERIHQSREDDSVFLLFNPAAFTHTSIALRDAILAVDLPLIECHLSNVHRREAFRTQSYFSDIAVGVICGFGAQTYSLAMTAALAHIAKNNSF